MKKEVLALALGIALLPPLWAVVSGHCGIECGAVALICAGFYVTNGNKVEDGVKMSLAFLLSDLWAVIAVWLMENLPFKTELLGSDINVFVTLAVMGFVAVLIGSTFDKWFFLPALLGGWAIGLTILVPLGFEHFADSPVPMPIQIGIAMLFGVWYVGWGVDAFTKLIVKPKE